MRARCLVILAAMIGLFATPGAPAAVQTVGVVDFYALRTHASFGRATPTRFAADELSRMLAGASEGRFVVAERATMEQAEIQLGWQGDARAAAQQFWGMSRRRMRCSRRALGKMGARR